MKLVQLNIEGDAHLEKVAPFLAAENADVVCIQEIFKSDMQSVCSLPHVVFLPMLLDTKRGGDIDERGIALFSRNQPSNTLMHYYYKPHPELHMQDRTSMETKRTSIQHGIIIADIMPGVRLATVHHTWTQNGDSPSEYQKHDTRELVAFMKTQPPTILCGDFNTPRGFNECYDMLIEYFEDCVPAEYTSSMHMPLHRVRNNPVVSKEVARYMVDYIFRTPDAARVRDVSMKCGMSDHCALTAQIG